MNYTRYATLGIQYTVRGTKGTCMAPNAPSACGYGNQNSKYDNPNSDQHRCVASLNRSFPLRRCNIELGRQIFSADLSSGALQTNPYDLETCLLALCRTVFLCSEDLAFDVLQTLYVFWSSALYRFVFWLSADLSFDFLQACLPLLSSSVFFRSADLLLELCLSVLGHSADLLLALCEAFLLAIRRPVF
jgi:hypothetical protein